MVQAAAWPSHASCNSTQPSNPFPSSDPCNFCPNELITISFSWNTPWARPISASEHCHVCSWACAACWPLLDPPSPPPPSSHLGLGCPSWPSVSPVLPWPGQTACFLVGVSYAHSRACALPILSIQLTCPMAQGLRRTPQCCHQPSPQHSPFPSRDVCYEMTKNCLKHIFIFYFFLFFLLKPIFKSEANK